MRQTWLLNPIYCEGKIVSAPLGANQPLLPLRNQIAFRASLLFNAWQAYACDGRQMSYYDCDRIEYFEERFSDSALDETAIAGLVEEFGNFLPTWLCTDAIDVPERALTWTQEEHRRLDANGNSSNEVNIKSEDPNPTIGLTYNGHSRTWGFRFSILDGIVLAVAFLVSYLGFESTNGLSLLLLFVVLHFFLFCNVFRIRRKPELIWAATFVANCIFRTVIGKVELIPISLSQLPITILLIVRELSLPCYHGVFARCINARLEDYLAGKE